MIDEHDDEQPESQPSREPTIADLALQVWAEARSGLTPLDSERAVKALEAVLERMQNDFNVRLFTLEVQLENAETRASQHKGMVKKMLQLVRGGYDHCPVCLVGDTQKHRDECWIRQLGSPVWTCQTTIDRRQSQANVARKKKGHRKSKGPKVSTVA